MSGSMDGAKIGDGQYTCRSERELEPYMECFWYLGNKIPSLYTPGRTITEETVDVNKTNRIYTYSRILHKQGQVWNSTRDFSMSKELSEKLMQMIAMPEEQMDGLTIEEYFGKTFEEFKAHPIWQCFLTTLAFKDYHSMIEMKRCMIRFIYRRSRDVSGKHRSRLTRLRDFSPPSSCNGSPPCFKTTPILFGARAFIPLFHTFSTVIPSLSTVLSTKLSTLSDVSFKIRSAQAGYNVHISVEIPRIWVSFGIADFIRLCTSPHELSTVIHRNLHRFSTVFVLKNGWTYKKRLSSEKERAAFLRAFQAKRRIYFDLS